MQNSEILYNTLPTSKISSLNLGSFLHDLDKNCPDGFDLRTGPLKWGLKGQSKDLEVIWKRMKRSTPVVLILSNLNTAMENPEEDISAMHMGRLLHIVDINASHYLSTTRTSVFYWWFCTHDSAVMGSLLCEEMVLKLDAKLKAI